VGRSWLIPLRQTKKVPPGPDVPPGQVIVNLVLLPLNAPAQCHWSIATAVPNGGPVVQNAPGPAQKAPAPPANPQAQRNPPLPAIPQSQLIPHTLAHIPAQIQKALPVFISGMPVRVQHAPGNPQAQNDPPPPAIPQAQLIPHPPAHIPPQIQQAPPVLIPGTPVWVQDAPPVDIQTHNVARQVPLTASNPLVSFTQ